MRESLMLGKMVNINETNGRWSINSSYSIY